MRSFRVVAAVALVALILPLAACSAGRPTSHPSAKAGVSAVARLTRVPDLRGKTLPRVSQLLQSHEVTVVVEFPAVTGTWTVEATRVAGVLRPAHVASHDVPERALWLGDVAAKETTASAHVVQAQSPAPGSALASTTTIELTVGPHPNNKTGRPWLTGHPFGVRSDGAPTCFACHSPSECEACHDALPH